MENAKVHANDSPVSAPAACGEIDGAEVVVSITGLSCFLSWFKVRTHSISRRIRSRAPRIKSTVRDESLHAPARSVRFSIPFWADSRLSFNWAKAGELSVLAGDDSELGISDPSLGIKHSALTIVVEVVGFISLTSGAEAGEVIWVESRLFNGSCRNWRWSSRAFNHLANSSGDST